MGDCVAAGGAAADLFSSDSTASFVMVFLQSCKTRMGRQGRGGRTWNGLQSSYLATGRVAVFGVGHASTPDTCVNMATGMLDRA
jgi:hypothetical protein